jgi:hypothetical protein
MSFTATITNNDDNNDDNNNHNNIQSKSSLIYNNAKDALQSIFVRLREKGVPVDVDFIEELERNVKAYRSLMRRQRGFGENFYNTPKASLEWDAVQKQYHVQWGDLFFDLTFVASSFRLGSLLEDVILHSPNNIEFTLGVFVFATLFLVMRSVWGAKLDFVSRFCSSDLVHKIFDIFEACIVAILASQIPTTVADLYAQQYYMIWNFTLIRLGLYVFNFCRWAEVGLLTSNSDETNNHRRRASRITAVYFMIQVITTGAPVVAAAALIYLLQPLWLIAFFWLCSEYFIFIDLFRAFIPCFNTRDNTVPLHVDHVVHREGEFCMLVLGEGVLSIVLLQTMQYPNTSLMIGSMVPAYLIMASIQVLHYSSQTWFAEAHALLRSRIRGQMWLKMQPIEAGLIVCVGVGVKVILKLGEKASEEQYWSAQWFLVTSLCCLFLMLQVLQVMHNGVVEELDLPWCSRVLKIALYGLKAFTSCLFLLIPTARSEGLSVLLGCWAVCSCAVILQKLWDTIDAFVAHASALAEEQDMEAQEIERRWKIQDARNGEASEGDNSNSRQVQPNSDHWNDDGGGGGDENNNNINAGYLTNNAASAVVEQSLRLLPKRLRNPRLEQELKAMALKYGGNNLELELKTAAAMQVLGWGGDTSKNKGEKNKGEKNKGDVQV